MAEPDPMTTESAAAAPAPAASGAAAGGEGTSLSSSTAIDTGTAARRASSSGARIQLKDFIGENKLGSSSCTLLPHDFVALLRTFLKAISATGRSAMPWLKIALHSSAAIRILTDKYVDQAANVKPTETSSEADWQHYVDYLLDNLPGQFEQSSPTEVHFLLINLIIWNWTMTKRLWSSTTARRI